MPGPTNAAGRASWSLKGGTFLAIAFAIGAPSLARAQEESGAPAETEATPAVDKNEGPKTYATKYSPYELYSIREAKRALKTELDFEPEGKLIERVEMLRLEVIEERDPVSDIEGFLNFFHTTTKPYVISRELLLRRGDVWQQSLADETARNLRGLPQLSLVLVVPMRGSAPDRVVMVVITKDVWSLRLNFNVSASQYGLEGLSILPSETNLAGSHTRVSGSFSYDPARYSLGGSFAIPRLQDTRVAVSGTAGVYLNHYSPRTSGAEGSYASFTAGQPLYSSKTKWAWEASVSHSQSIVRKISRADIDSFNSTVTPGVADRIPYEYGARVFNSSYGVTRSFGWEVKHDVGVSYEISIRDYTQLDPARYDAVPVARDPRAVADFARRNIPTSDTRSVPVVAYHTYTTNFLRIIDFSTLALQEDYRLGHDVSVSAYPVLRALGSSRSVFGTAQSATYTFQVGRDGFLRGGVASVLEIEPSRGAPADDAISDGSIGASLTLVTPRFFFGRVVFDVDALNRYRNFLNRQTFIGGSGRLRGYPTSFTQGENFVAGNVEIRTRPIDLVSVLVGLAAFYDAAAAFDGSFADLRNTQLQTRGFLHGAGVGLRTLFPQLDRFVFRADFAVPLRRIVDPATCRSVPNVVSSATIGGLVGAFGAAPGVECQLVDPFAVHVAFGQAF